LVRGCGVAGRDRRCGAALTLAAAAAAGLAQVNPAMVATGEWRHANQYAVYLVHERVRKVPY
jgi:hypothetical protein